MSMTKSVAAACRQHPQTAGTRIRRAAGKVITLDLFRALPIVMMLWSAAAVAETFGDGLRAYEFSDYSSAYSIWLRLAKQGDAESQSSLGFLHHEGRGVPRNRQAAARWYYLAAIQGEPTAQSFLCEMHMRGDGVKRSLELALAWCELSIEGGETRGIYFRERVMERMTTQQRDAAWELVSKLRKTKVMRWQWGSR